ncbi:hypothetical protein GQ44DRAFT_726421 [Phaeosphaeriaceae sp. PMI808]|nr:hypothetical protein GQ44DRAFT_726421 [Phaeosphaeriaceae sp. PMI808]
MLTKEQLQAHDMVTESHNAQDDASSAQRSISPTLSTSSKYLLPTSTQYTIETEYNKGWSQEKNGYECGIYPKNPELYQSSDTLSGLGLVEPANAPCDLLTRQVRRVGRSPERKLVTALRQGSKEGSRNKLADQIQTIMDRHYETRLDKIMRPMIPKSLLNDGNRLRFGKQKDEQGRDDERCEQNEED